MTSLVVDGRAVALTRCRAAVGALENQRPHQGGPVGEGSIENGWLRCPWHGYDYDPLTGIPPEGFTDAVTAYDVEERDGGVYEPSRPHGLRLDVALVCAGLVSVLVFPFAAAALGLRDESSPSAPEPKTG